MDGAMRFVIIEARGHWVVMRGAQPATVFEGSREECLAYVKGFEAAWTFDNRQIELEDHGA
jgi:hypothetical protein